MMNYLWQKPDEEKAMLLEDKVNIFQDKLLQDMNENYLMYISILKVIQSLFTTLRVMAIIELLSMKNTLKHGMIIGSGKNRRKRTWKSALCLRSN